MLQCLAAVRPQPGPAGLLRHAQDLQPPGGGVIPKEVGLVFGPFTRARKSTIRGKSCRKVLKRHLKRDVEKPIPACLGQNFGQNADGKSPRISCRGDQANGSFQARDVFLRHTTGQ